jgi:hypothetical protein
VNFFSRMRVFALSNFGSTILKKHEGSMVQGMLKAISTSTNSAPQMIILTERLVETETEQRHPVSTQIRLLWEIFNTRGLTRMLITVFPSSVQLTFTSAQKMSRDDLLRFLWRNREVLKRKILFNLSLEFMPDFKVKNYTFLTRVDYLSIKFEAKKDLESLWGFETRGKSITKVRIVNKIKKSKTENVIHNLIRFNPSYFMRLVYNYDLSESFQTYLLRMYPSLWSEISSKAVIPLDVHPDANNCLDLKLENSVQSRFDVLENVEVWHQRFLVKDGKWQIIDATTDPRMKFVAGQWQFVERIPGMEDVVLIRKPRSTSRKVPVAIFLCGRCDENWYHFLIDTLPRLEVFQEIPLSVPLLIRSDIPRSSKDLIRKLVRRRIIEIRPDSILRVDFLYFLASRSSVFDSKAPVDTELIHLPFAALKKLRDRVIEVQDLGSRFSSPDTFYLKRNSVLRGILNPEAVEAVVRDLGIDTLEANSNFFKFQVSAFHKANLVVIPGGASVANILFMKPGAKVLILKSWRNKKLNLWKSLALGLELEYKEINGVPSYYGLKNLHRMHSNYWIPSRKFRRELSKFNTSRT